MVLNTQLEHAPVRVFQPRFGDVSHLLCTHVVESDATGLLMLNSLSAPWRPKGGGGEPAGSCEVEVYLEVSWAPQRF